jgi:hypothetical protein
LIWRSVLIGDDRHQNNLIEHKHLAAQAFTIQAMKKTPAELPDDVELLKKMLLEQQVKLERQLAQKDKRIAKLETLNQ